MPILDIPHIGINPVAPPTVDDVENSLGGQILEGIGDLIGSLTDAVVSIADLTKSAFEGAKQILESISNFIATYDFMFDFFPSEVESYVFAIFSIMVTVITFKVVGYFT